jgi:hypothetical protein
MKINKAIIKVMLKTYNNLKEYSIYGKLYSIFLFVKIMQSKLKVEIETIFEALETI